MEIKKIYDYPEALVSDDLIDGGDSAINAALPEFKAGAIIYTAGYKKVKQKSLNGSWVDVNTGSGLDTSDATATATDIVAGKSAYVNGQKIIGSVVDNGAAQYEVSDDGAYSNIKISTDSGDLCLFYPMPQRTVSKGAVLGMYVTAERIAQVIRLTADKIKAGETILGITGTYTG